MRTTNLALSVLIVAVAVYLYHVKYAVQDLERSVRSLHVEIQDEREAIQIYAAEWSFVTRPVRLERLNARHLAELNLAPATARQIVSIDAIPFRPEPDPDRRTAFLRDGTEVALPRLKPLN